MYTRTKDFDIFVTNANGSYAYSIDDAPIELMRSYKIKPVRGNYVFHSKASSKSSISVYKSAPYPANTRYSNGYFDPAPDGWGFLAPVPGLPAGLPLNREKIPTSSESNLIVLISELRETTELFLKKFWQDLTYGAVSWAIIPAYSELQAVLGTLDRLSKLAKEPNWRYDDELILDVDYNDDRHCVKGQLTYRLSGFLRMGSVEPILKLYDSLGFHPDLQTFWEAVPISWLIDAFLPIGAYLDQQIDQGWVEHVAFTGWSSIKFVGEFSSTSTNYGLSGEGSPCSVYERNYHSYDVLQTYFPDKLNFEYPSVRDVFNLLYISKVAGLKSPSRGKNPRLNARRYKEAIKRSTETLGAGYLFKDLLKEVDKFRAADDSRVQFELWKNLRWNITPPDRSFLEETLDPSASYIPS